MRKFELSKSDVKAVRDSVAHWKRDVRAKLKRCVGIKVGLTVTAPVRYKPTWADNGEEVPCFSKDCPLCPLYASKDCVLCPYYRKYGLRCDVMHWRMFIEKPCLKTCNGMIKALEDILK